ncbi:hypothetical protein VTK56DRAFT_869 [Thermocarpiscus australiensis]
MAQLPQATALGTLTGPAKLDAVTKLVDKLAEDLESATLEPKERDAALEELKVYGRDPNYADPIFTKEGMGTLVRHAFDSSSDTTSRSALRVLCNAMLLKPEARQIFVDLGYEAKACNKLKAESWEDEFLVSRVIFLATYGTSIDLPKLIEQCQLADSIAHNLSRHASLLTTQSASKTIPDPMEEMALSETLKLLFNVTRFASNHVGSFDQVIPHIMTILCSHDLPQNKTPLDPPFGLLVNALMNLNLASPRAKASFYPSEEPSRVADRLIQLLDLSMTAYSDSKLDEVVVPLLCVLQAAYEHAPDDDDDDGAVHAFIRDKLLPGEADRKAGLGKADTLPSRLLRNWTNPLAPEFRRAVSHFYFALSRRDAARFVENVGYGYASGFLFENKIPVPESAMQGGQGGVSSAGGEGPARGRPVNPITGQFLDEESFPDIPEMTAEEKEREAERLFVLFERLKQTGVINVQNPVEKAVQEGRFEELPDDDDDNDLVEDLD